MVITIKIKLHTVPHLKTLNISKTIGAIQKPRGQQRVGRWSKICHFCPRLVHKKCPRGWVGGQKRAKLCPRGF